MPHRADTAVGTNAALPSPPPPAIRKQMPKPALFCPLPPCGTSIARVARDGLLIHQQYRSPPPRPSPAAGFALRGRGKSAPCLKLSVNGYISGRRGSPFTYTFPATLYVNVGRGLPHRADTAVGGNECCATLSPTACNTGTNAEIRAVLPPPPVGEGRGGVKYYCRRCCFGAVSQDPPYNHQPASCERYLTA